MVDSSRRLLGEVTTRLDRLADLADAGGLDAPVEMIVRALDAGGHRAGVRHRHSQAFAMEIAGRAGGLIPTNNIALRDVVLLGGRDASILFDGAALEREPTVVDDLWETIQPHPEDVFVIASNSGVNGSVVGMAIAAKAARPRGHRGHEPRAHRPGHPQASERGAPQRGRRRRHRQPGAVRRHHPHPRRPGRSSRRRGGLLDDGGVHRPAPHDRRPRSASPLRARCPPIYLSANIPAGDDHNNLLENQYGDRLRRHA
jgi:uncharacterized phosphosugar-binding protein